MKSLNFFFFRWDISAGSGGWGEGGGPSLRMQLRQGDQWEQPGLCAPALSHTPFHLLLYGSTVAV